MSLFTRTIDRLAALRWRRLGFLASTALALVAMTAGTASATTCYDWTYRVPSTQYQVTPAQFTTTSTSIQNVTQYIPVYSYYRDVTTTTYVDVPSYSWQLVPSTNTTYEYRFIRYDYTTSTNYTYDPVYATGYVYDTMYWHTNYYTWGSDYCVSYSSPVNCGSHASGWRSHSTTPSRYLVYSYQYISYWALKPHTTTTQTAVYGYVPVTTTTYSYQYLQSGTTRVPVTSTSQTYTSSYSPLSSPWIFTGSSMVANGTTPVSVTTSSVTGQYVISSNGSMSLSGSSAGTKSWGANQWVDALPTGSFTDGNQYRSTGATQSIQNRSSQLFTLAGSATAPTAAGAFDVSQSNGRTCEVRPT